MFGEDFSVHTTLLFFVHYRLHQHSSLLGTSTLSLKPDDRIIFMIPSPEKTDTEINLHALNKKLLDAIGRSLKDKTAQTVKEVQDAAAEAQMARREKVKVIDR